MCPVRVRCKNECIILFRDLSRVSETGNLIICGYTTPSPYSTHRAAPSLGSSLTLAAVKNQPATLLSASFRCETSALPELIEIDHRKQERIVELCTHTCTRICTHCFEADCGCRQEPLQRLHCPKLGQASFKRDRWPRRNKLDGKEDDLVFCREQAEDGGKRCNPSVGQSAPRSKTRPDRYRGAAGVRWHALSCIIPRAEHGT